MRHLCSAAWLAMLSACAIPAPGRSPVAASAVSMVASPWAGSATAGASSFERDLDVDDAVARIDTFLRAHQLELADRLCAETRASSPELEVLCGRVALELGDRRRAESLWSRGAAHGSTSALLRLAILRLEVRDFPGALDASARFVATSPASYQGLRVHAAALAGAGGFERAEASLLRAVELAPERPGAYLDLGLFHLAYDFSTDAQHRALDYFNQFVSRAGTRPEYAPALSVLMRHCPPLPRGRRLRARHARCVPGLMDQTLGYPIVPTNSDIAELMRMAAQMEAESRAADFDSP